QPAPSVPAPASRCSEAQVWHRVPWWTHSSAITPATHRRDGGDGHDGAIRGGTVGADDLYGVLRNLIHGRIYQEGLCGSERHSIPCPMVDRRCGIAKEVG